MNETSEAKRHPADHRRAIRLRAGLILLTLLLAVVSARVYVASPKYFSSRGTVEPLEFKPDNNRGIDAISGGGGRVDLESIPSHEYIISKSHPKTGLGEQALPADAKSRQPDPAKPDRKGDEKIDRGTPGGAEGAGEKGG